MAPDEKALQTRSVTSARVRPEASATARACHGIFVEERPKALRRRERPLLAERAAPTRRRRKRPERGERDSEGRPLPRETRGDGKRGPCAGRRLRERLERRRAPRAEVRREVAALGLSEPGRGPRLSAGRPAVGMDGPCRAHQEELSAGAPETPLPVVLLVVEPVALVERPDGFDRPTGDRHQGARDRRHLERLPAPQRRRGVQGSPQAAREDAAGSGRLEREAAAREVERPGLLERRNQDRRFGIEIGRRAREEKGPAPDALRERGDGAGKDGDVRVHQEEDVPARRRDPLVQAGGIAEVPPRVDRHVGDFRDGADLLRVLRVDDRHGLEKLPRLRRVLAEKGDGARREGRRAVADDDDGDHAAEDSRLSGATVHCPQRWLSSSASRSLETAPRSTASSGPLSAPTPTSPSGSGSTTGTRTRPRRPSRSRETAPSGSTAVAARATAARRATSRAPPPSTS